jgi:hypothetical protein
MDAMLEATTRYLKITTRHLQHDGRHVGSYHVVPKDYYDLQHDGRHVGSYYVDIKPDDCYMLVVTTWH